MPKNTSQIDFPRLFAGSISGLLSFLLLLSICLLHPAWQGFFEQLAGDQLRKMLAKPLSSQIELVYLDQDSLRQAENSYNMPWPWPRDAYGQALGFLKTAGAKAVIFDFLFTSASSRGPEDDQAFAQAIQKHGAVFAGMQMTQESQPQAMAAFRALPRYYDLPVYAKQGSIFQAQSVEAPKPPLWGAFAGVGDVTFLQDPDSLCRRQRLLTDLDGRIYPSLTFAAYWFLQGKPKLSVENGLVKIGNKEQIPLNSDGSFYLLYRSEPSYGPQHPRITLFDLASSQAALLENKKPSVDPARLKDKIVVIGSTAPALVDLRPSPLNKQSPGFVINAVALDNFLTGQHLRVISLGILGWLGILLLCILISVFAFRLFGLLALFVPGFSAGLLWWAYNSYGQQATLIPIATPLAAILLSASFSAAEHYFLEFKRRRSIQTAFGQFLSPDVFKQLLADRRPLQTGGEKQPLTVLFSDLQGFTSFSEKLDPTQLVDILNYYLTEMAEVIVGQGKGYVDKYEGDAIMAFWGAPTANPAHALAACRAAWLCQKRLAQIQPELARRGLAVGPEGLVMRIGINSGDAVVGLMGSPRKLNYTAMGDTVNLASRLEGSNKAYGSRITISEATRIAAGSSVLTRELDLIRVKGKLEPTRIHELIGLAKEGEALLSPAALAHWNQGLAHYRQREFSSAKSEFRACLSLHPSDSPSQVYFQRCEEFEKDPPAPDWDGVYVMKTK